MEKENIQSIEAFLLEDFIIEDIEIRRIKVHRNHNLIMKNRLSTKEKNGFMMIAYIKCLTCNYIIWENSIRGDLNYLSSISNKIIDFQHKLQQNEKIIKKKAKEDQDKELEKLQKAIVDKNKKLLKNSIATYKLEGSSEGLYYNRSNRLKGKKKKAHYQRINGLLNKYKEKVEHIEDKGHFPLKPEKVIWCGDCENFDSKGFCNIYDCYPLDYKIPVEEYCNKFTLDMIKAEESKKRNKLTM